LLAAATAPTSELELFDTTQQELDISDAAYFLEIFAEVADVFIFTSPLTLNELEQEKNMPAGGILRQALRLSATSAVRGILSSILSSNESIFGSEINSTKYEAIRKFIKNKSTNVEFKDQLLQTTDLQRLKNLIYRDMEEVKQAQFLALSIVYFLSVLMVSRYRDILEPPPQQQTNSGGVVNSANNLKNDSVNDGKQSVTKESAKLNSISEEDKNEEENHFTNENEGEKEDDLEEENVDEINSNKLRRYLTDKLQKSIEPVIPLFREILCDFRSFLQKTLLGTHGQEIMNDVRVMHTLKNGSVIEIVMLLCSQEWQTSLQKHSGLAFIELVNEGRLMAHATRDHILRVANEADFILNRLRAEDVSKHAQFESEVNDQLQHRKTEEQLSNQLIISARRREFIQSTKFLEKIVNILTSPTGAWYSDLQKNMPKFEKLDVWEDDSRMRRRFVHNPYGQRHSISSSSEKRTTKNLEEEQNKIKKDEDLNKLLKDLARKMIASGGVSKTNNILQQFVDETEIERLIREEENSNSQSTFSTFAKLIAPGVIVPGTITLTGSDLYFDADEDDQSFKQNLQHF
uniref:BEACH-type PH domain-containing protein n=1 Tax=Meloidogyne floridensis TaxID=298350 RepID=A0A915P9B6_9BILA